MKYFAPLSQACPLRIRAVVVQMLTLMVLCIVCVACSSTTGIIMVGQPEVFTRQRLIDARSEDHEWLRGKLDESDEAEGFHGYIDRRMLDVTIAQLQVEYGLNLPDSPAPSGDSADEPDPATTEEGKVKEETEENTETAKETDQAEGDHPPRLVGQGQPTLRKDGTRIPSGPPDPSKLARSSANVGKINRLNDQLAHRAALRNAMRQVMLDDSHDQTGGTLYDLKFDVVLQPGRRSRDNAIVVFTIKENSNCDCGKDDRAIQGHEYRKWVQSINEEANRISYSLQNKLLQGSFSQSDEKWIVRAANQIPALIEQSTGTENLLSGDQKIASKEAIAKDFQLFLQTPFDKRSERMQNQQNAYSFLVAQAVSNFYESRLKNYTKDNPVGDPIVTIGATANTTGPQGFWTIPIKALETGGPESLNAVLDNIKNRYSHKHPVVVDTTPKEQAQNLSDVGAGRYMINLLAGFNGAISSQANLGAEYERLIDEQITLQAVKRQPLIIGFNDSSNRFGYILGPEFEIEKKFWSGRIEPEFRHRAVRHTVGAAMIAPITTRCVKLEYKTFWVTEEGQFSQVKSASSTTKPDGSGEIEIRLPLNFNGLSRAVLYSNDEEPLQPILFDPRSRLVSQDDRPAYKLQAGEVGDLLLRGVELWRNPQVFIGSQRADRAIVLADLNGVHARFNKDTVKWIGPDTSKPITRDLTIITSYGASTLHDAVQIFPPKKASAPKSTAVGLESSNFTKDNNGNVSFGFRVKSPLPKGYSGLRLRAREANVVSDYSLLSESPKLLADGKTLLFTVGTPHTLLTQSKMLELRPEIQMAPGDDYTGLLATDSKKSGLYIHSESDKTFTVAVPSTKVLTLDGSTYTPSRIVVSSQLSHDLRNQLTDGFTELIKTNKVQLTLNGGDFGSYKLAVLRTDDNQLEVKPTTDLSKGLSDDIKEIKYTLTLTADGKVVGSFADGQTITVKRK